MFKIVLDTNVIISAALSPTGNCARIIRAVAGSVEIKLFYSPEILLEYKQVLSREHLKIGTERRLSIIDHTITNLGTMIEPAVSDIWLPDETDRIFYDTAQEAEAILITGNIKHYPAENLRVLTKI
jgi:putative PIN family toxin of toxin-antitoxin system